MRPNNILLFLLTLTDLSVDVIFAGDEICPKRIADDIGEAYQTAERFNNIRKAVGNELTTKFVHHRKKDEQGGEEYEYKLTFCGTVNSVAVKQIDIKKNERSIALHDNSSVLIGAEDWLFLQYRHGDNYNNHCNKQKKQAWVSIICEDQGEKPKLRVIEEARFDSKGITDNQLPCYFLFEYNHPAACSPRKKPLSGGAVFCIIVLVLFSAYLIFGFLYQRFVLRASGLEQIPHYSFWRKFGNTMADGCDFVCRSKDNNPNLYKGITDDLDMDSSDDDKDGLLPM